MKWHSAKIRLVCLVEGKGGVSFLDSLILLRADGFDHAFERVLEIGRGREEDYLNAEQRMVSWRFSEVLTLDVISSDNLDGVEVYSDSDFLDSSQTDFHPERSTPIQTI